VKKPEALIAQLSPGGRLVMPIGDPSGIQELIKVTKQPDGILKQENLGGVRFVPRAEHQRFCCATHRALGRQRLERALYGPGSGHKRTRPDQSPGTTDLDTIICSMIAG